jgi:serine/threonine-protein kinase
MEAGDRLSYYRIVGKLGEGGMGVVYRAEDVRLGRAVALKVLAPQLAGNVLARRRFEAEARAASALDHPNICALYDVGETPDGRLFLALAFCEGETLQHTLERGPLEVSKAIAIAVQIAAGLNEAHAKGIVHRDIKPANVMLRPDGLVKILDFGVAKIERDAGITGPADSIGSPAYMAPEQIRGGRVGATADVWALGVVLFEMIAGRRPFEGDGMQNLFYSILEQSAPALDTQRPGVHPEISRIVARALAKEPAARFPTVSAFADAMRAVTTSFDQQTRVLESVGTTAAGPGTGSGSRQAPRSPPTESSLAVLPFSDLSPGRDQEWFCEGLAEELITSLSEVRALRVASRASTQQFRDQDPRAIGEKLQVGILLTGSVRKAANRVRITTQVVKVDDGSVIASARYDRDLDDVFALQEEIARATVEAVVARIDQGTAPRVRRPTESIEAYNLYLEGRYNLNRRTVAAFREAIPLFERAIALDPSFAAAYAGLADIHVHLALHNAGDPHDLAQRGKELCRRAIALDSELLDARITQATIRALFDWDWGRAESELRAVLAINPARTTALHSLAVYVLAPLGRMDAAIAEIRSALAIDAVSIPFQNSLGYLLHFARRSNEALAQLRATLDRAENPFTRVLLSEILIDLGRADEGAEILLADPGPLSKASLAMCFARSGKVEEARAILEEMQQPPAGSYPSDYFSAVVLVTLGELEAAIECLERAATEGVPTLAWLGVRPVFDPLRGHPRFQRILERMRLPNVGPGGPIAP